VRLAPLGGLRELVPQSARGGQLAPGPGEIPTPAQLLLPGEGIEDVELVGGPGKPALLELPGHRHQPLDERRQLLARHVAPPGVGARAPVGEHTAGGHEGRFALGPQLRDRGQVGVVEDPVREVQLGLDVRLGRARAQVAGVAARPEQEAERLREDRLSRAGLAGDGVQAGREREIRVADEDEVLDAEAAQGYENTSL
jgi:hypothetical protein